MVNLADNDMKGNDHVEIVEVSWFSRKFGISEFSHNAILLKLSFMKNILYMFVNCRTSLLEQFRHLLLRQQAYAKAGRVRQAVGSGVENGHGSPR